MKDKTISPNNIEIEMINKTKNIDNNNFNIENNLINKNINDKVEEKMDENSKLLVLNKLENNKNCEDPNKIIDEKMPDKNKNTYIRKKTIFYINLLDDVFEINDLLMKKMIRNFIGVFSQRKSENYKINNPAQFIIEKDITTNSKNNLKDSNFGGLLFITFEYFYLLM